MARQVKRRVDSLDSPVEASELIQCFKVDLSEEARYLIGRLTTTRLTIVEIIDELIQHGFRQGNVDESRLIRQLHNTRIKKLRYKKMKRRGKIFGFWCGEWYVLKSVADPKVIPVIKYGRSVFNEDCTQFRSTAEDVLDNSGPLTLGQIVEAVIRHPAYTGPVGPYRTVQVGIDNVLRRNDWMFEKKLDYRGKIPRRYARWGLVGVITPPVRPVPQKDLLYAAMRSVQIIKGWSLSELIELVRSPELGFGYCQRAPDDHVKAFLISKLRARGETRYQRLGKGHGVRYRALPMIQNKKPSTPTDWDSLVEAIYTDLETDDYEYVEKGARQYGHLFGWDTSTLPESYLSNQIGLALSRMNNS